MGSVMAYILLNSLNGSGTMAFFPYALGYGFMLAFSGLSIRIYSSIHAISVFINFSQIGDRVRIWDSEGLGKGMVES